MATRMARRSGIAVVLILDALKIIPDVMCHVGVGLSHPEIDILRNEYPNLKFVGFEPHPKTYEDCKDSYPGVLVNCALGDKEGFLELKEPRNHRDGTSVYESDQRTIVDHHVFVNRLDAFAYQQFQGLPYQLLQVKNSLLWIDVEGYELHVLQGAKRYILERVNVINVEMTSRRKNWDDPVAIHNWLMYYGFLRQWTHTQRINSGQSDAIYVKRHLFNREFCCCPCQMESYDGEAKT